VGGTSPRTINTVTEKAGIHKRVIPHIQLSATTWIRAFFVSVQFLIEHARNSPLELLCIDIPYSEFAAICSRTSATSKLWPIVARYSPKKVVIEVLHKRNSNS
jgi:hypothetical protein